MSEMCAQCGRALFGVVFTVTIGNETFRVCSFKCEDELKAEKLKEDDQKGQGESGAE